MDGDLKEEMLKELMINPSFLHTSIKNHFEKIQMTRDKLREYSNVFIITQKELSKLKDNEIPFSILSETGTTVGERRIDSYIIGFKTLENFYNGMRSIEISRRERQSNKKEDPAPPNESISFLHIVS
jgi:hypothetical protein